jgi:hypothetical protein
MADDDYDEEREQSCYPRNGGKPRLLSRQCETCIYRPGNLMHLSTGRLKSMTEDACREGCQGVICHDTLDYGGNPEFGGALCRGFYDNFGSRNGFIRIIERLGGFDEVDPPKAESG